VRPSEHACAILTDSKIYEKGKKEDIEKFIIIDEGSVFSREETEILEGLYYIPKDIHIPASLQSLQIPSLEFIDKSSERVISSGGKIVYPVNGIGENAGIIAKHGLEKFSSNVEIFALCNGRELLGHGRDFAYTIASFRNALPSDKVLYLPGIAQPQNIALFAYLGFDLFDTTSISFGARKGLFYTNYGVFDSKRLKEIPCNCQACIKAIIRMSIFWNIHITR
jgi:predicted RNA-binding protein